jgi:hypothetical protein
MKLEKIITNNIEAFNADEPSDSHFEKFRRKLERRGNKSARRFYRTLYKAAAVLLFIVMSAGVIRFIAYSKNEDRIKSISQVSKELCEVEMYYLYQINTRYDKIKELSFYDRKERRSTISELKDMDSDYQELKEDLSQNPYDERVINAIIGYYMVKLESMDKIIIQAKKNRL